MKTGSNIRTCQRIYLYFSVSESSHLNSKQVTARICIWNNCKINIQKRKLNQNFQLKSKHTGDYQYRCRACEQGFNNYNLMEEHFHIHTGSKPYECNKCDKSFANRGSLWIHMKQHENLKPYICNQCNKAFTHSSHLANNVVFSDRVQN